MNLFIKTIFYLNGGNIVEEGLEYTKRDETVTDEAFRKDIENIMAQLRGQINEGIVTDDGKIIQLGNTIVRFSDISAYQIIIVNPEEIENENEDEDLEEEGLESEKESFAFLDEKNDENEDDEV
jgi:hypothetical protein